MAAPRWPRHWPRNGLARDLSWRISSSFRRATPHSFPRSRQEKQSANWNGPCRKAWNIDHIGTLTMIDALAFGLERDSFIRPGTAPILMPKDGKVTEWVTSALPSLRRGQFFLPAQPLRSPRRAGDVARLQVRAAYHPGIAIESAGDEQIRNRQADRRDDRKPDPIMEKLDLVRDWRGGFLETDLSRHGVPVRMGHTWQTRRRKKPVPKVSIESRGRPGKPQKATLAPRPIRCAYHCVLNLLRRWVNWFKTTNAYRAQPAALRHKRALKALLGKAAETAMGFRGRNRRRRAATIYQLLKHAGHAGTQNRERYRRGPRRTLVIITLETIRYRHNCFCLLRICRVLAGFDHKCPVLLVRFLDLNPSLKTGLNPNSRQSSPQAVTVLSR